MSCKQCHCIKNELIKNLTACKATPVNGSTGSPSSTAPYSKCIFCVALCVGAKFPNEMRVRCMKWRIIIQCVFERVVDKPKNLMRYRATGLSVWQSNSAIQMRLKFIEFESIAWFEWKIHSKCYAFNQWWTFSIEKFTFPWINPVWKTLVS